MVLLYSKPGEKARLKETDPFPKEVSDMQKYISDNPRSIPLDAYKKDANLLIICGNFYTPQHGEYIDHVGIDKNGEIYLIEAKKDSNTDSRHVMSQILGYSATFANESFEDFKERANQWIEEKYNKKLEEKLQEHFGLDDEGLDYLLREVERYYNDKKAILVIVMNGEIEEKLKTVVDHVHENCKITVFLIQFKRYVIDGLEIIVPEVFGAENSRSKAAINKNWRKADFDAQILGLNQEIKVAISKLISFTKEMVSPEGQLDENVYYSGVGSSPMFVGLFPKINKSRGLWRIEAKTGNLWMRPRYLEKPQLREEFLVKCKENHLDFITDNAYHNGEPKEQFWVKNTEWVPKVDTLIAVLKKVYS